MSNIEKIPSLQKALEGFILELKKLEVSQPDENEFRQYLIDHVAPLLTEDDQLFGTSVFAKLDVGVYLSKSTLQQRHNSLENSLYHMNNSGICWLLNYVWSCTQAVGVMEDYQYDCKVDAKRVRDAIKSLSRYTDELQDWLNSDLYERIQEHEYEINQLRGIKS